MILPAHQAVNTEEEINAADRHLKYEAHLHCCAGGFGETAHKVCHRCLEPIQHYLAQIHCPINEGSYIVKLSFDTKMPKLLRCVDVLLLSFWNLCELNIFRFHSVVWTKQDVTLGSLAWETFCHFLYFLTFNKLNN